MKNFSIMIFNVLNYFKEYFFNKFSTENFIKFKVNYKLIPFKKSYVIAKKRFFNKKEFQ